MTRRLSIQADLNFSVEVPGQEAVHGLLRGSGSRLVLAVDRPEVFASRADSDAVNAMAEALAQRGLIVEVRHDDTHLVTMGDVHAPWWQRRATGSKRIRLGSFRGVLTAARLRFTSKADSILPNSSMAPPPTMWPLAPTMARPPKRAVTTTHDPARGGKPHLALVTPGGSSAQEKRRVFGLTRDVTTIGSGADCSIRLSGLADLHADIVHDDEDEFVVRAHQRDVRVNGAVVTEQLLRTGSRLEVGGWTFAYSREEYADHGRPFGGRIGGEFGHQQPQNPRRRNHDDDQETT